MCESQTERVEVHSLDRHGEEWALCVYQTPSVLRVVDSEIAEKLQQALDHGASFMLTWEPETGLVVGCS